MSEDYLDLLEAARDALGDLLRRTTPGGGMMLRHAYNDLNVLIEKHASRAAEADRRADDEELRQQVANEHWEREQAWKWTPTHERERLILDLLGDERLTIAELTARLAAARTDCGIYESKTRSVVNRLVAAGELDRAGEEWRSRIRYRYFRKSLSGPIVDLDQAYHEPSDPEAS